jgi:branched-chain amino acid transport system ATP-binding protein
MGLLDIRNLHVHYGKIHALRGVSLTVGERQIITLIGANGAGKTTTLKAISGILAATDGEIELDGRPLKDLPAHAVVGKGIVQVPEGRRIFSRLTVAENLGSAPSSPTTKSGSPTRKRGCSICSRC